MDATQQRVIARVTVTVETDMGQVVTAVLDGRSADISLDADFRHSPLARLVSLDEAPDWGERDRLKLDLRVHAEARGALREVAGMQGPPAEPGRLALWTVFPAVGGSAEAPLYLLPFDGLRDTRVRVEAIAADGTATVRGFWGLGECPVRDLKPVDPDPYPSLAYTYLAVLAGEPVDGGRHAAVSRAWARQRLGELAVEFGRSGRADYGPLCARIRAALDAAVVDGVPGDGVRLRRQRASGGCVAAPERPPNARVPAVQRTVGRCAGSTDPAW